MSVVSDSSPLITLSKIGRLDVLEHLYRRITVTPQVYEEVAVRGVGLKAVCVPASGARK